MMKTRAGLLLVTVIVLLPRFGWAQIDASPPDEPALELPSLEEELGQTPPDDAPLQPSLELPPEMPDEPAIKLIPPAAKIPSPPFSFSPPTPAPVDAEAQRLAKTVTLKGLDKITARVSTFDARIDQPARFGGLRIIARDCHKRPPEETPETSAFLEIIDLGPTAPADTVEIIHPSQEAGAASITLPLLSPAPEPEGQRVFSGWMFASSPALSALEHPVYDISVIDCATAAPLTSAGNK